MSLRRQYSIVTLHYIALLDAPCVSFVSKSYFLWQLAFWCDCLLYDGTFKAPNVSAAYYVALPTQSAVL